MVENYIPVELRRLVEQRANGCCEYCWSQEKYSAQPFSIEHIIPRSAKGCIGSAENGKKERS